MLIDIKSYIVYSCFYLIEKHLFYLFICDFRRNSLYHSALSCTLHLLCPISSVLPRPETLIVVKFTKFSLKMFCSSKISRIFVVSIRK